MAPGRVSGGGEGGVSCGVGDTGRTPVPPRWRRGREGGLVVLDGDDVALGELEGDVVSGFGVDC